MNKPKYRQRDGRWFKVVHVIDSKLCSTCHRVAFQHGHRVKYMRCTECNDMGRVCAITGEPVIAWCMS